MPKSASASPIERALRAVSQRAHRPARGRARVQPQRGVKQHRRRHQREARPRASRSSRRRGRLRPRAKATAPTASAEIQPAWTSRARATCLRFFTTASERRDDHRRLEALAHDDQRPRTRTPKPRSCACGGRRRDRAARSAARASSRAAGSRCWSAARVVVKDASSCVTSSASRVAKPRLDGLDVREVRVEHAALGALGVARCRPGASPRRRERAPRRARPGASSSGSFRRRHATSPAPSDFASSPSVRFASSSSETRGGGAVARRLPQREEIEGERPALLLVERRRTAPSPSRSRRSGSTLNALNGVSPSITSAEWKSAGFGLSAAAAGPSPCPAGPWHDAQFCGEECEPLLEVGQRRRRARDARRCDQVVDERRAVGADAFRVLPASARARRPRRLGPRRATALGRRRTSAIASSDKRALLGELSRVVRGDRRRVVGLAGTGGSRRGAGHRPEHPQRRRERSLADCARQRTRWQRRRSPAVGGRSSV